MDHTEIIKQRAAIEKLALVGYEVETLSNEDKTDMIKRVWVLTIDGEVREIFWAFDDAKIEAERIYAQDERNNRNKKRKTFRQTDITNLPDNFFNWEGGQEEKETRLTRGIFLFVSIVKVCNKRYLFFCSGFFVLL